MGNNAQMPCATLHMLLDRVDDAWTTCKRDHPVEYLYARLLATVRKPRVYCDRKVLCNLAAEPGRPFRALVEDDAVIMQRPAGVNWPPDVCDLPVTVVLPGGYRVSYHSS
jgi:hypothetical protein